MSGTTIPITPMSTISVPSSVCHSEFENIMAAVNLENDIVASLLNGTRPSENVISVTEILDNVKSSVENVHIVNEFDILSVSTGTFTGVDDVPQLITSDNILLENKTINISISGNPVVNEDIVLTVSNSNTLEIGTLFDFSVKEKTDFTSFPNGYDNTNYTQDMFVLTQLYDDDSNHISLSQDLTVNTNGGLVLTDKLLQKTENSNLNYPPIENDSRFPRYTFDHATLPTANNADTYGFQINEIDIGNGVPEYGLYSISKSSDQFAITSTVTNPQSLILFDNNGQSIQLQNENISRSSVYFNDSDPLASLLQADDTITMSVTGGSFSAINNNTLELNLDASRQQNFTSDMLVNGIHQNIYVDITKNVTDVPVNDLTGVNIDSFNNENQGLDGVLIDTSKSEHLDVNTYDDMMTIEFTKNQNGFVYNQQDVNSNTPLVKNFDVSYDASLLSENLKTATSVNSSISMVYSNASYFGQPSAFSTDGTWASGFVDQNQFSGMGFDSGFVSHSATSDGLVSSSEVIDVGDLSDYYKNSDITPLLSNPAYSNAVITINYDNELVLVPEIAGNEVNSQNNDIINGIVVDTNNGVVSTSLYPTKINGFIANYGDLQLLGKFRNRDSMYSDVNVPDNQSVLPYMSIDYNKQSNVSFTSSSQIPDVVFNLNKSAPTQIYVSRNNFDQTTSVNVNYEATINTASINNVTELTLKDHINSNYKLNIVSEGTYSDSETYNVNQIVSHEVTLSSLNPTVSLGVLLVPSVEPTTTFQAMSQNYILEYTTTDGKYAVYKSPDFFIDINDVIELPLNSVDGILLNVQQNNVRCTKYVIYSLTFTSLTNSNSRIDYATLNSIPFAPADAAIISSKYSKYIYIYTNQDLDTNSIPKQETFNYQIEVNGHFVNNYDIYIMQVSSSQYLMANGDFTSDSTQAVSQSANIFDLNNQVELIVNNGSASMTANASFTFVDSGSLSYDAGYTFFQSFNLEEQMNTHIVATLYDFSNNLSSFPTIGSNISNRLLTVHSEFLQNDIDNTPQNVNRHIYVSDPNDIVNGEENILCSIDTKAFTTFNLLVSKFTPALYFNGLDFGSGSWNDSPKSIFNVKEYVDSNETESFKVTLNDQFTLFENTVTVTLDTNYAQQLQYPLHSIMLTDDHINLHMYNGLNLTENDLDAYTNFTNARKTNDLLLQSPTHAHQVFFLYRRGYVEGIYNIYRNNFDASITGYDKDLNVLFQKVVQNIRSEPQSYLGGQSYPLSTYDSDFDNLNFGLSYAISFASSYPDSIFPIQNNPSNGNLQLGFQLIPASYTVTFPEVVAGAKNGNVTTVTKSDLHTNLISIGVLSFGFDSLYVGSAFTISYTYAFSGFDVYKLINSEDGILSSFGTNPVFDGTTSVHVGVFDATTNNQFCNVASISNKPNTVGLLPVNETILVCICPRIFKLTYKDFIQPVVPIIRPKQVIYFPCFVDSFYLLMYSTLLTENYVVQCDFKTKPSSGYVNGDYASNKLPVSEFEFTGLNFNKYNYTIDGETHSYVTVSDNKVFTDIGANELIFTQSLNGTVLATDNLTINVTDLLPAGDYVLHVSPDNATMSTVYHKQLAVHQDINGDVYTRLWKLTYAPYAIAFDNIDDNQYNFKLDFSKTGINLRSANYVDVLVNSAVPVNVTWTEVDINISPDEVDYSNLVLFITHQAVDSDPVTLDNDLKHFLEQFNPSPNMSVKYDQYIMPDALVIRDANNNVVFRVSNSGSIVAREMHAYSMFFYSSAYGMPQHIESDNSVQQPHIIDVVV